MASLPLPAQSIDVLNAPIAPGVSCKNVFQSYTDRLVNLMSDSPIGFANSFAAIKLIPVELINTLSTSNLTDASSRLVTSLYRKLDNKEPEVLLLDEPMMAMNCELHRALFCDYAYTMT